MSIPPLPSPSQQGFLAYCGVIQWAQAVCRVRDRIIELEHSRSNVIRHPAVFAKHSPAEITERIAAVRTEHDFFTNAAVKLLAFRGWAGDLGLFASVDFSGLDAFDRTDVLDARNMREHITEYFGQAGPRGAPGGRDRQRWVKELVDGSKCDASASSLTMIGGRLDYAAFAVAVEKLLPALLAEPIPFST